MSVYQGIANPLAVNASADSIKGESGAPIMAKDSPESIEKWITKNTASRFAISMYFRWILRSLQKINLPLPPMNKQQIYSASGLPGCNFAPTLIDPNIGAQINSSVACALKTLEMEVDQSKSLFATPSDTSFTIKSSGNGNLQIECSVQDATWNVIEKGVWKGLILFDLASYFFTMPNF